MAMDGQKFCLKWDGFQGSVTSLFDSLRQEEELVDITLCCEGQQIRAHRMMLSACSPYFRDLLKNLPCQQLVFFIKDTSAADLSAVIEFIYKGSVNVAQSQLASFIKTAELLQIRGLSGEDDKGGGPPASSPVPRRSAPPPPAAAATPPHKRRRLSGGDLSSQSPTQRPRTPTPPPASQSLPNPPPPPPPPPPAALEDPLSEPPAGHQPTPGEVKVEKIDLTEEDDDESLDATLCHVAEYEGGYDGSDHSMEMPLLSASELGNMPLAGPSSRASSSAAGVLGQPGDEAAGSDALCCDICGRQYFNRDSLLHHKKVHLGATTCTLCGCVYAKVAGLRDHLRDIHRLSVDQIRAIVPTRKVPHISTWRF